MQWSARPQPKLEGSAQIIPGRLLALTLEMAPGPGVRPGICTFKGQFQARLMQVSRDTLDNIPWSLGLRGLQRDKVPGRPTRERQYRLTDLGPLLERGWH